jgi:hypothetical protein
VTFAVTTNGEEDSLQWYLNGSPLTDGLQGSGSTVAGADSNSLTITNVKVGDEGDYQCESSKANFTPLESGIAELLTERLFAHWEFEGDLTDSVGGYDAVTLNVDPVDANLPGDPNFMTGHIGQALAFVDDGAEVADLTDFDFFNRGYTVSCWSKLDETATPTQGVYYAVTGAGAATGTLWIASDNPYNYGNPDGPNFTMAGMGLDGGIGGIPNTGQWQYMAVTYDVVDGIGTHKFYVDGELVDTSAGAAVPATGTPDYLKLGQLEPGYTRPSTADNVKIHTYALDATEIATEYVTDDPGSSLACIAHPEFDLVQTGSSYCVVDLADFAAMAVEWLDMSGAIFD